MDMFDEARAIRSTMELCGMTQSALAHQLGVSQSYIANKLRLLHFSDKMIEKIQKSGVSERHARTLLRLDDEESCDRVLDAVVERGLTVRECEAMVDSISLGSIPKALGRAGALDRIATFRAAIVGGVDVLTSFGIEAKARTSYTGEDMYITVYIKNA